MMSKTKLKMISTEINCIVCFKYKTRLINETCLECISCSGKERYSTPSTAKAVSRWFNQSRDYEYLNPYKCRYCNKYHLGHDKYAHAS